LGQGTSKEILLTVVAMQDASLGKKENQGIKLCHGCEEGEQPGKIRNGQS